MIWCFAVYLITWAFKCTFVCLPKSWDYLICNLYRGFDICTSLWRFWCFVCLSNNMSIWMYIGCCLCTYVPYLEVLIMSIWMYVGLCIMCTYFTSIGGFYLYLWFIFILVHTSCGGFGVSHVATRHNKKAAAKHWP